MKMKNQMSSNRPSNSYDSAVSLTIFKLFSWPNDKTPNLRVFWEISVQNKMLSC